MSDPLDRWKLAIAQMQNPEPLILHTGSAPWEGTPPKDVSKHWADGRWIGTDIKHHESVDIVCDLHEIDKHSDWMFDAVYSIATLEHLARPWVAVKAIANVMKPGGALYLESHQCFPIHGYPSDYFRFTIEALTVLCGDAGLRVIESGYSGPCTLTPGQEMIWNPLAPTFLNVAVCCIK